jgi:hypothetical protein
LDNAEAIGRRGRSDAATASHLGLSLTRELRCDARDAVTLRTKPGVANLADLVRSALRLRPDRIVVGEVSAADLALSLSQTQSDWQLIENRVMLLRDERTCQARCLDGRRSVSVADSARDGNLDVAAADKRSAANRS